MRRRSGYMAIIALGALLAARPVCASSVETAAELALAQWGNRAFVSIEGPNVRPVATTVKDHFGPVPYDEPDAFRHAAAAGGKYLGTAGSGSIWMYDPVHHIAVASSHGDLAGDAVFYTESPPAAFPQRDLSHLVSARGLRLGISTARAAALLGVLPDAVRHFSPGRSVLYVRTPRKCEKHACAYDATLIFERDKAVAISLYAVGP